MKKSIINLFNDRHFLELFKGGGISFLFRLLGLGLGFILTLIIANLFGASGLGEYVLAITILRLFTLIAKIGIDTTSIRFIASFANKKKWSSISFFRKKIFNILVITSIFSSLLMYFFAINIAEIINIDYHYIKLNAFFVLPMTFFMLHYQSLRGLKHISDFSFFYRASQAFFSIIFITIIYQFNTSKEVPIYAYLLSLLIVSFLSFITFNYRFKYKKRDKVKDNLEIISYKSIFKISIPLMFAQSVQFIMAWTDKLMLGAMASSDDVGIYHTAFKLSMVAAISLMSINSIAAPKFAEFFGNNDLKGLRRVVKQSTKMIFWTTLPMVLLFFLFPEFLLGFFGVEFKLGVTAFMLLSFGRLISAFSGSVGNLLQMTNNQNIYAILLFIGASVNIILNLLLIPISSPLFNFGIYGINGAAFASMSSLIIWNISMVIAVKKKFGFLTFYIPILKK